MCPHFTHTFLALTVGLPTFTCWFWTFLDLTPLYGFVWRLKNPRFERFDHISQTTRYFDLNFVLQGGDISEKLWSKFQIFSKHFRFFMIFLWFFIKNYFSGVNHHIFWKNLQFRKALWILDRVCSLCFDFRGHIRGQ